MDDTEDLEYEETTVEEDLTELWESIKADYPELEEEETQS